MSVSVDVKRVFLSFIQQYYAEHPTLTWNVDPRLTKIFIADKYAVDPSVVEKLPSIILNLGTRGFARTSIGQVIDQELTRDYQKRTDILRGNIVFQCTSKNGIEAETMADGLLLRIMAFKTEFTKHGIHQILETSVGEEQVIRGDASIRTSMVPVYVQYTVQTGATYAEALYDFTLTARGIENYERIDFLVSGQNVSFYEAPPVGSSFMASYTGRFTLNTKTESLTGAIDGTNKYFTITEEPYSDHPVLPGYAITTIPPETIYE
jgi:hypothetical protein